MIPASGRREGRSGSRMVVGRMALRRRGKLQAEPMKTTATAVGGVGSSCGGCGCCCCRGGGGSGSGGSGGCCSASRGGSRNHALAGSDAHDAAADGRQDAFAKGIRGEEHALGADVETAAVASGGGRQGREDTRRNGAQRIPAGARRDAHLRAVLLGGRDGGGRGTAGGRLLDRRPGAGATQRRHRKRSRGHGIDVKGDRRVDVPVAAHPLVLHGLFQ